MESERNKESLDSTSPVAERGSLDRILTERFGVGLEHGETFDGYQNPERHYSGDFYHVCLRFGGDENV